MNRKNQIAVNTIFYIMMVLFMIAIIVFGIQKLNFTKEIVSEQERLDLQKELKNVFEYCEEPLNKGNIKHFKIKSKSFNSICILGDDFSSWDLNNHYEGFTDIYESGDNIILLKTDAINSSIIHQYQVMDSFKAEVDIYISACMFDYNNTGIIKMDIKCG